VKGFILSLGILFSVQVFAARWVIENPAFMPKSGYKIIKQFSIGKKDYLVIETQDTISKMGMTQALSSLNRMFAAQKSMQDIPIELVKSDNLTDDRATSGWHVQRMKYDQLNPQYQGQGVVVAVLDTGVEISHPNLRHVIWKNLREIPNNNVDDDGNGYIDDIHGWNFSEDNNNVSDDNDHGTHCAGIIAASKNPTRPDRGIAPMATIMPVRVIGSASTTFLSDAAEAVVYATNNGAHILSNSWRVYKSWSSYYNPQGVQMLSDAIAYAGQRGVLFVGAAGNEARDLNTNNQADPIFPLSLPNLPNMIGVASGDSDGFSDLRSGFTNYGAATVHLAAPGSNIYSTVTGGRWRDMSGTSMAAPLVAGALARLMSQGYTAFQAYQKLAMTVDPKAKAAWNGYVAYGFINLVEAMK
jgi:subtilisin family serine protease